MYFFIASYELQIDPFPLVSVCVWVQRSLITHLFFPVWLSVSGSGEKLIMCFCRLALVLKEETTIQGEI